MNASGIAPGVGAVVAEERRIARWQDAQRGERGAELIHGALVVVSGELRYEGVRGVDTRVFAYPCGIPSGANVLGGVASEYVTCPRCRKAARK